MCIPFLFAVALTRILRAPNKMALRMLLLLAVLSLARRLIAMLLDVLIV
jgi:hypothetical protein